MEQNRSRDYGYRASLGHNQPRHPFELKGAFLKELRDNTFSGSEQEDANEHIEKVEIVDKFFCKYYTLSRASKSNDANVKECHLKFMNWLSSKFKNPWKFSSATKNELWNFWEKGYDNITLFDDEESSNDDCDKSNLINHHDTSPFLNPYQAAKNEGIQRHHMKCNDNNSRTENFIQNDAPHSGNNNKGNEGICRVDKFEVIKYSIRDNE
ncbi:hypothetical protein Tco_1266248 [Tanacetum coccineum]